MAKPALNKASLNRERGKLKTYERFLPSLDLKRKQLLAELAKARRALAEVQEDIERLMREASERLPMAAHEDIDLSGLVRVTGVHLEEENRMGARLPVIKGVDCAVEPYGMMSRPAWVDGVVATLKRLAEQRLAVQVAAERVERLRQAVRKITQRVNLFDKVLIPNTKKNIKTIEIYLSDTERAAVVRAKIAKQKHAKARKQRGEPVEEGRP